MRALPSACRAHSPESTPGRPGPGLNGPCRVALACQCFGLAAAIGTRPFAIVHGQQDQHALVHHGTDLAAVVARSVPGYEPWLVPCAHHVEAAYCATAEYEARLVDFFTRALGAP